MLEETLANGNVFKRDESWSHVVKKINLKTYVIEYNIVSGFKNKEEALGCSAGILGYSIAEMKAFEENLSYKNQLFSYKNDILDI